MQHDEQVWKRLLLLKNFLREQTTPENAVLHLGPDDSISLYNGEPTEAGSWLVDTGSALLQPEHTRNSTIIRINDSLLCSIEPSSFAPLPDAINFIRLYLPAVMALHFARLRAKPYVIAHLTQSIDGRIATGNGHSKWIGNQEDLCHVHRLRCLCDAVLVGSQTVQLDEPRLTVRHVEGPSPRKVIVGNTACKLDSLLPDDAAELLSFSNQPVYPDQQQVREYVFDGEGVACSDILNTLFQENVFSVLIEGGAKTVSRFISEKQVDSLQIHIANKLLGSGRAAFALPEIEHISESIHLKAVAHYKLGDEILLTAHV
jgi:riboflavin-specific deaminase-like protein